MQGSIHEEVLLAGAAGFAALFSLTQAASAQTLDRPTVTASAGYANFSTDDVDLGAVQGRVAVGLHPNFRIEGEAAVGVSDDDFAGVDIELNHQFAGYVVGVLPLSPNAELFGRVGYGTTDVEVGAGGFDADIDDQSVNYGVGGSYYFDGLNGVRADYTRQDFDGEGGEVDVLSLAYSRRF